MISLVRNSILTRWREEFQLDGRNGARDMSVLSLLSPNQAKWMEEQTSRTEEFQRELQKQSGSIGDLEAEKVTKNNRHCVSARCYLM